MRRIIEIVWLAVAAFCIVEASVAFQNKDMANTQLFAVVSIIALSMYGLRRWQRARREKQ